MDYYTDIVDNNLKSLLCDNEYTTDYHLKPNLNVDKIILFDKLRLSDSQTSFDIVYDNQQLNLTCRKLIIRRHDLTTSLNFLYNSVIQKVKIDSEFITSLEEFIGLISTHTTTFKISDLTTNLLTVSLSGCDTSSLTSINLYNVENIDDRTFQESKIKQLYCNKVISIGEEAFSDNKELHDLNIKTLNATDKGSFIRCEKLQTVQLNNCVNIGEYTFDYCTNLTTIVIPQVKTIDDYGFNKCEKIIGVNATNCRKIGKHVFEDCSNIYSVNIPKTTTISQAGFKNCQSMVRLKADAVKKIKDEALSGCQNLFDVNLPMCNEIGTINGLCSKSLFIPNITTLNIKNSEIISLFNTSLTNVSIENCDSLTSLYLPNVETLNITNCPNIKYVYAPKAELSASQPELLELIINTLSTTDLPKLEYLEFNNTTITSLPTNVTTVINESCLTVVSTNTKLKYAYLPNVVSISSSAFKNCHNLLFAYFDSLTTLSESAFENCVSLEQVSMKSLTTISSKAFKNCLSLSVVNFSSLINVSESAFENCVSLENFSSNEVLNIHSNAFTHVKRLCVPNAEISEITTPNLTELVCKQIQNFNRVTKLEHLVLTGNQYIQNLPYSIKSVVANNVLDLPDYAFANCSNLSHVEINSCTKIGKYAFKNCNLIKNIYIPSCEEIDSYAFYYTQNLKSVHAPSCTNVSINAFNTLDYLTISTCDNLPEITEILHLLTENIHNLPKAKIVINNNCTTVEDNAFVETEKIIIPNARNFSEYSFNNCSCDIYLSTYSTVTTEFIGYTGHVYTERDIQSWFTYTESTITGIVEGKHPEAIPLHSPEGTSITSVLTKDFEFIQFTPDIPLDMSNSNIKILNGYNSFNLDDCSELVYVDGLTSGSSLKNVNIETFIVNGDTNFENCNLKCVIVEDGNVNIKNCPLIDCMCFADSLSLENVQINYLNFNGLNLKCSSCSSLTCIYSPNVENVELLNTGVKKLFIPNCTNASIDSVETLEVNSPSLNLVVEEVINHSEVNEVVAKKMILPNCLNVVVSDTTSVLFAPKCESINTINGLKNVILFGVENVNVNNAINVFCRATVGTFNSCQSVCCYNVQQLKANNSGLLSITRCVNEVVTNCNVKWLNLPLILKCDVSGCSNLTEIVMPQVEEIINLSGVKIECLNLPFIESLPNINIPTLKVVNLPKCLTFEGSFGTLDFINAPYYTGSLGNVETAFVNTSNIGVGRLKKYINFGSSITSINPSSLEMLVIPNVKEIPNNCFKDTEVENVYLPNVTKFGDNCLLKAKKVYALNKNLENIPNGNIVYVHDEEVKERLGGFVLKNLDEQYVFNVNLNDFVEMRDGMNGEDYLNELEEAEITQVKDFDGDELIFTDYDSKGREIKSVKNVVFPNGKVFSVKHLPNETDDLPSFENVKVKEVIIDNGCVRVENEGFRNSEVEKVVGDGIINIGDNAFDGCEYLKVISLENCKTVGKNAFGECVLLTNISLGNCETLSEGAFIASGLKDIYIPKINILPNYCFIGCKFENYENENINTVGEFAFSYCKSLSSVSMISCNSIGERVFLGSGIKEFEMNYVNSLPNGCFESCESIEEFVDLHITSIGNDVFKNCKNLKRVILPFCETVGVDCFVGCDNLEEVVLGIENVSNNMFRELNKLKRFEGENVKSVGNGAFYECTYLTSVIIPNCENIDWSTFQYCASLSDISLPYCVSIGGNAFHNCRNLKSVIIPKCVNIDKNAFNNCRSLTNISSPVCINIGENAFYNCESLTNISLPVCENIGPNAFTGCNSSNISLPNCKNIDIYAFAFCTSLTDISLPVCENICEGAFYTCSSLTNISLPKCVNIGLSAFVYCSSLTNISLPACENIKSYSFNGCYSLTNISLPSCKNINNNAFYNCRNLNNVTLLSTEELTLGSKCFMLCTGISTIIIKATSFSTSCSTDAFDSISSTTNVTIYLSSQELVDFANTYFTHESNVIFTSQTLLTKPLQLIGEPHPEITELTTSALTSSDINLLDYPNVEKIIFTEALTLDSSFSFNQLSKLTTVIADKCESIGVSTFNGCTMLTNVSLQNCEKLERNAFFNCTSLIDVNLPNVTTLFDTVFVSCSSLETINLPNCEEINAGVFSYCVNLKNVYMPKLKNAESGSLSFARCGFTQISLPLLETTGMNMFGECTSLTSVDLPECKALTFGEFNLCTSLTNINIPKVTSIGFHPFSECHSLQEINLPSVTEFTSTASTAFGYCYNLQKINLPSATNLTSWPNNVFNGIASTHESVKIVLQSIELVNYAISNFTYDSNVSFTTISEPFVHYKNYISDINLITPTLTFPDSIDGITITSISQIPFAFSTSNITTISHFPSSAVDFPLFYHNQVIKNLIIDNHCTIRPKTFSYTNIEKLTISSTVTIQPQAFLNANIQELYIESVPDLTGINPSVKVFSSTKSFELFQAYPSLTIISPSGFITSNSTVYSYYTTSSTITFPSSCTSFSSTLTVNTENVVVPSSYRNLPKFTNEVKTLTYYGTSITTLQNVSLEILNIPSVQNIPDYAFMYSFDIKEIHLESISTLLGIQPKAFYSLNCKIFIPESLITSFITKYSIYPIDPRFENQTLKRYNGSKLPDVTSSNELILGFASDFTISSSTLTHLPNNASSIPTNSFSSITVNNNILTTNITINATNVIINDIQNIQTQIFIPTVKTITLTDCLNIGNDIFKSLSSVTSITLEHCKTIQLNNFVNCNNLQFLAMNECETINNGCLRYNSSLSLVYANKLKNVGDSCFVNLPLSSITLTNCEVIGNNSFLELTNVKNINLPNVKSVGDNSFNQLGSSTSLTINIPKLESIHSNCFCYCTFTNFTSYCESIENGVFKNCHSLKSVLLPNLKIVGSNNFNNCESLTDVYLFNSSITAETSSFSDSVYTVWCRNEEVVNYLYNLCHSSSPNVNFKVYQPFIFSNTSLIGWDNLFVGETVICPNDYEKGGSNITVKTLNINLLNYSVKYIDSLPEQSTNLFENPKNIIRYNINNLVESLPDNYFKNSAIKELYINNIKTVGSNCFENCTSLTSLTIPNCENIKSYAFKDCELNIVLEHTSTEFTTFSTSAFNGMKGNVYVGDENIANLCRERFSQATDVNFVVIDYENDFTFNGNVLTDFNHKAVEEGNVNFPDENYEEENIVEVDIKGMKC